MEGWRRQLERNLSRVSHAGGSDHQLLSIFARSVGEVVAVRQPELLLGIALADDAHREPRQAFVDAVTATIPVLDYDRRVAHTHARLLTVTRQQGRPRGAHDLLITATAVALGRTVVTADPQRFADLPDLNVLSHS